MKFTFRTALLLGTIGTFISLQSSFSFALSTDAGTQTSVVQQQLSENYKNLKTQQQHSELYQTLLSRSKSAKQFSEDETSKALQQVLPLWLDWYALYNWAYSDEKDGGLEPLIALAHTDPLAALKQLQSELNLNPKTQTTSQLNPKQSVSRQLLYGMIASDLDLFWLAAQSRTADDSNKIENYVRTKPAEFGTGELCYSVHYKGRTFSEVQQKYPGTRYAEVAAFLAMRMRSCGECEGQFDCYLSRQLDNYERFLKKYPHSELAEQVLSLALIRLEKQFSEREANRDYLSSSDNYQPQQVADTLTRFEQALHALPNTLQSRLKLTLLPYYQQLNQSLSSQRVLNWLKQNADNDTYQLALRSQEQLIKPALYVRQALPFSDKHVQISWDWRNKETPHNLYLWRASQADFSDAKPISSELKPQQLSYLDPATEPGQRYWYQLRAANNQSRALSHWVYHQTDLSVSKVVDAPIRAWFIDASQPAIYLETSMRLNSERTVLAWRRLDLNRKVELKSALPVLYSIPGKTWYFDVASQRVVNSSQVKDLMQLNLTKAESTPIINHLINSNSPAQVLEISGAQGIATPDKKNLLIWQNRVGLWRSDFNASTPILLYDDKNRNQHQFVANKQQAMLYQDPENVLILGGWQENNDLKLGWRSFDSKGQMREIVSSFKASAYANLHAFAADQQRQPNFRSLFSCQPPKIKTFSGS